MARRKVKLRKRTRLKVKSLRRRRLTKRDRKVFAEQRRRSRAAKQGWKTRRKRQRAAKRKHRKFRALPKAHRPRLQLSFRLNGPRGSTQRDRIRAIATAIRTGALPVGWSGRGDKWIGWRNPDTKHGRSKEWQYDTLEAVMPSLGRVLRPLFGVKNAEKGKRKVGRKNKR